MERVSQITCKFCGQTRRVTYSDYFDEGGRTYGMPQETNNDKGCSCQLGQAAFQKYQIKKMCMNCKYNELNRCTNSVTKSEISSQFDVKELVIKDSTKKCKNWEMSSEVFKVFAEER